MQSRQPLQTFCWMKTVSYSVLMIASVGQTSMQLACVQCLQMSDISSQALPLPDDGRPLGDQIDELDVPVVFRVELSRVVEAVHELRRVARQLVPLFAGDFAGLAADANARVREESDWFRHLLKPH